MYGPAILLYKESEIFRGRKIDFKINRKDGERRDLRKSMVFGKKERGFMDRRQDCIEGIARFAMKVIEFFPFRINKILTDNGKEFINEIFEKRVKAA